MGQLKVVSKTLTTTSTTYATGKVIGGIQTVTDGVLNSGGVSRLKSITLANQNASTNVAVDIIFFDSLVSCGADTATFAITVAESYSYLGHISLVAGDYTLNSTVSCLANKVLSGDLLLKAANGVSNQYSSTKIYFVVVARASNVIGGVDDVQVKLGLDQE